MSSPLSSYEQIKEKILALQSALLEKIPTAPVLLQEIHRNLKNDPECVTLLEESEMAIIVQGLETQTNTHIVTQLTKSSAAAKTSLKKVKAEDMGF